MNNIKQVKEIIQIRDPSLCCGCMACRSVCLKGAIDVYPDDLGFLYPVVNPDTCIACGRCVKVCPNGCFGSIYNDGLVALKRPLGTHAAQAKDENILLHSSSGGVATILSSYIVGAEGGVVYGCGYSGIKSVHRRAASAEEIKELQGSKYTQSDLGDCFLRLKEDLKNERKVLFIGTPCQVAGLLKYLGDMDISKLTTIDLICHGVTGDNQLIDYIKWIESRTHAHVEKIIYRDKSNGWGSGGYAVISVNGARSVFHSSFDYYHYYLKAPLLRTSCYSCKFAQSNRIGDLTVGDFWGIDEGGLPFNPKLGTSLVLVNSSKGAELFFQCSSRLAIIERSLEEALNGNRQLVAPSIQVNDYLQLKERLVNSMGSGQFASLIAKKYLFQRIKQKAYSVLLRVRKLVK